MSDSKDRSAEGVDKKEVKALRDLIIGARALRKAGKFDEALDKLAPHEEKWGNRALGFVREQALNLFHVKVDGQRDKNNDEKALKLFDKIISTKDATLDQRMEALYCNVILSGRLDLHDRAIQYGKYAIKLNEQFKDAQTKKHEADVLAEKAAEDAKAAKKKKPKKKEGEKDEADKAIERLAGEQKTQAETTDKQADFIPKEHIMAYIIMGCALEVKAESLGTDAEKAKMLDQALEYLDRATGIDSTNNLASHCRERLLEKSMEYLYIGDQEVDLSGDDMDTDPNSASGSSMAFGVAAVGTTTDTPVEEGDIPLEDKPDGAPTVINPDAGNSGDAAPGAGGVHPG